MLGLGCLDNRLGLRWTQYGAVIGDGVGLAKVATFQPSRTHPSSKLYPFAQDNGQPHSL